MKLHSFVSRLQEVSAYLEEYLTDTKGQETAPLPADEIMDIIYHSIPTVWNNKMIEQDSNYGNSNIKETADFFESRVENLEPKEEKQKSSTTAEKIKEKIPTKKGKKYTSIQVL